jgi:hypothetical protein
MGEDRSVGESRIIYFSILIKRGVEALLFLLPFTDQVFLTILKVMELKIREGI